MDRSNGEFNNLSSDGFSWSNVANDSVFARDLGFNGSSVRPESNNYKTSGFAVRYITIYSLQSHSRFRTQVL